MFRYVVEMTETRLRFGYTLFGHPMTCRVLFRAHHLASLAPVDLLHNPRAPIGLHDWQCTEGYKFVCQVIHFICTLRLIKGG
jgi:hypothetical protein